MFPNVLRGVQVCHLCSNVISCLSTRQTNDSVVVESLCRHRQYTHICFSAAWPSNHDEAQVLVCWIVWTNLETLHLAKKIGMAGFYFQLVYLLLIKVHELNIKKTISILQMRFKREPTPIAKSGVENSIISLSPTYIPISIPITL